MIAQREVESVTVQTVGADNRLHRHQRYVSRWLAILLLSFALLGTVYSVVSPVFEVSDELWHYPLVKHLADGGGLPVQDPAHIEPWRQEGSQPPLYYALAALATSWIDTRDASQLRWLNPHADNGVPTPDGNVNMVIHSSQEAFPWHGAALAVHVARLLSVLMSTATVYLTYLLGRDLFPDRPELALGAAALNAFLPMFLFIAGSVNNDNLVAALCSWALLLIVRWVARSSHPPSEGLRHRLDEFRLPVLIGVVVGLAALSKESALGLGGLIALAAAVRTVRDRAWRRTLIELSIIGGLVAVIAGWWYVRNRLLYGDWLGLNVFLDIAGRRVPPASLRTLLGERWGFAMAYWGLFGGVNVPMDMWVYWLLNGLAGLAAAGLAWMGVQYLIRHFTTRIRTPKLSTRFWQFALVGLWPVLVLISLIQWTSLTLASQGRLMFAAISSLSLLMAAGLAAWLPRRLSGWGLGAASLLMAGIAVVAPFATIRPAYTPPPPLTEAQLAGVSNPMNANFGALMRLAGYRVATERVMPGGSIELTLYWQVLAKMDRDWSVFVHLIDGNEIVVAQRDRYPGQGLLATRLLAPGTAFADRFVLHLPDSAYAPDRLQFEVGLYDLKNGERLPATVSGRASGDAIRFQPVDIVARPGYLPNPVSFNFGDQMTLAGYSLDRRRAAPGGKLHLTLYWRGRQPMDHAYTVFTHILGRQEHIWGQKDAWPGGDPTTAWQPGELVSSTFELQVKPDTPPDVYDLEIGLYRSDTLERLQLVTDDGRLTDNYLILTKVRVVPGGP